MTPRRFPPPWSVDNKGSLAASMDERMAYNTGKRLLLVVLLKGLAGATHRNDRSTAERYCRRIRLAAEQIAADEPVQNALKRVLSGLWIEAAEVDRDETAQQMLKLIDRGIRLLAS